MQAVWKRPKSLISLTTLFSNTVLSSFWAFATLLVIMRWAHILKENMMIRLALLLVGGMSLAIATNAPDALFSAVPIVWVWNFSPKLQPWHLLELEKRRETKIYFSSYLTVRTKSFESWKGLCMSMAIKSSSSRRGCNSIFGRFQGPTTAVEAPSSGFPFHCFHYTYRHVKALPFSPSPFSVQKIVCSIG